MQLVWLDGTAPFPPAACALDDPPGLLAAGGATIAAWALGKTRHQLDALGRAHDIPLYTLAR